jgi:hypothetical protein
LDLSSAGVERCRESSAGAAVPLEESGAGGESSDTGAGRSAGSGLRSLGAGALSADACAGRSARGPLLGCGPASATLGVRVAVVGSVAVGAAGAWLESLEESGGDLGDGSPADPPGSAFEDVAVFDGAPGPFPTPGGSSAADRAPRDAAPGPGGAGPSAPEVAPWAAGAAGPGSANAMAGVPKMTTAIRAHVARRIAGPPCTGLAPNASPGDSVGAPDGRRPVVYGPPGYKTVPAARLEDERFFNPAKRRNTHHKDVGVVRVETDATSYEDR